ncbi:MAG: extracellular solute-binding protein, partial [Peptostreptococcaceae bacterium]|nr:extracellular solute-binding protein [Peptostreptococcaceae bacterium]
WNEGKTFPSSSTQMENMFADGELNFGMTYAAYGVAVNIENQKFKPSTQTFLFDKGMVGNTNYIAIPINSPNKAGAIVAINEMISPEVQAERFKTLRTLPVVDHDMLSTDQQKAFDAVDIGKGVLPQDELLSKKLPEMPAKLVPIIEEIWLEEVVGK